MSYKLKNDSLFNLFKEELKNIKIQASYIVNEVYSVGLIEENFEYFHGIIVVRI